MSKLDSFFNYLNKKDERRNIRYEKQMAIDAEKERQKNVALIFLFGILFLISIFCFSIGGIYSCIDENKRQEELLKRQQQIEMWIEEGRIPTTFTDESLVGQKYTAVKQQLELAGFTNIHLIDLNDGGFLGLDTDKVKTISINGISDFLADDYFFATDKIIITYY